MGCLKSVCCHGNCRLLSRMAAMKEQQFTEEKPLLPEQRGQDTEMVSHCLCLSVYVCVLYMSMCVFTQVIIGVFLHRPCLGEYLNSFFLIKLLIKMLLSHSNCTNNRHVKTCHYRYPECSISHHLTVGTSQQS